ncbi:MAG TPA: MFS transporter [Pirellulales bacterium]|nr:MFS transporter [Pirellulales bacterium]
MLRPDPLFEEPQWGAAVTTAEPSRPTPEKADANPYQSPAAGNGAPARHKGTNREIFAWAIYDWANSAYSTLSITVLTVYILKDVLPGSRGTLLVGLGLGITTFVSALLSPVLGAVADANASKRRWLAGTAFSGAGACVLMFFTDAQHAWAMVILYIVSVMGMELSQTFYNAFLPELAEDERMDRVSSWGYALGYVGGGLALAIVLLLFMFRQQVGLSEIACKRIGLLLMGLWWGGFSLPTVLVLKDKNMPAGQPKPVLQAARVAFHNIGHTLRNIRSYRMLTIFILGFLVYNDGVQTVISQASVFATELLGMGMQELVGVVLMIQFIAFPGALAVGWLAERFGQKIVLMGCLAVWTMILALSFLISERWHFWCMAAVVALVLGGTQSVSRSIMGLMTPPQHAGEFFGFFNFSGKATSVFGPSFFSIMLTATESPHLALASLLAFFVVGWMIIAPLNVAEGQRQSRAAEDAAH